MGAVLARWRWWLVAGGVCLLAGGPLHPDPNTALSFRLSTAGMLGDSRWVPAHALMLAGFVLLVPGLAGLLRAGILSKAGEWAARVALVGAGLSVVEMAFHLSAVTERHALAAGHSTPIVDTHMALAVVAYPLLGFGVAALALIESGRLGPVWRVVCIIGALGAAAHGLSAPIVVLSQDQHFSSLFKGAIGLALWLVLLAAVAPKLAKSAPRGDQPEMTDHVAAATARS